MRGGCRVRRVKKHGPTLPEADSRHRTRSYNIQSRVGVAKCMHGGEAHAYAWVGWSLARRMVRMRTNLWASVWWSRPGNVAELLNAASHAVCCVQGNCTGVPDTVAAAAEPLAPLKPSQCVITATATLFSLPPLSHRVWLHSLYLRLESPPAAAGGPRVATGITVQGGDAGSGGGVSLWITDVTVQGRGPAASRGLLVEHPQATVHAEGASTCMASCACRGHVLRGHSPGSPQSPRDCACM